MSGFNYAASISAAYASSDALPHPHARLASGRWLAFTGWESNPLDSIEKFLPVTSDFLLSQAYPGASLASSRDKWCRRAALVATVPLNAKSRGATSATGDATRTLAVCTRLLDDRAGV